ncbi:MAG: hypothetical protein ABSE87_12665 [Terracidiphilus sp.]|jgi:hypothetical protein
MTEITQPAPEAPSPAFANPAVARCCAASARAYKAAVANGKGKVFSDLNAEQAYRNNLPPLSGPENIRDFIACVAHGMLIGAIEGPAGARLLYAAQVAATTVRSQPSPPKSA